jgi:hypothetical protein
VYSTLQEYKQRQFYASSQRDNIMNVKMVLFSGILTALVGSIIGLASANIGQRDFNQLRFESEYYQYLHNRYALIGAGIGFAVGVTQECVRELQMQQEKG